ELAVRPPAWAHRIHPQLSWRDWFSGNGDRWEQRDKVHLPIRRPHLSAPYVSSIDGAAYLSLSVPIRDPDHRGAAPVGVLEAALDLDELNRWMRGFDLTGGGFLAGSARRWYCLEHPARDRIRPHPEQGPRAWEAPELREALALSARGTLARYLDPIDGQVYLAGYARTDERIGWVVVVQHNR